MEYETKIVLYKSFSQMNRGIEKMQAQGWEVAHTETVSGGFGLFKTTCLGCLFLPLALFGRKSNQYKVQFRRSIN